MSRASAQPTAEVSEEEARSLAQQAEKQQLESLMDELKEAIDKSQALEPFKDQLLLDITPEGLRIQIVDKQNRPMFDLGKSNLKDYTGEILREVAKYLNTVPNRVSLSGHTDDKPYGGARGYTNWELSADRANAARRALLDGGLEQTKIARVVGLASSVLFDRENPYNPINRRISIIVMTKSAEATALSTDAPDVEAARKAIESGAADRSGWRCGAGRRRGLCRGGRRGVRLLQPRLSRSQPCRSAVAAAGARLFRFGRRRRQGGGSGHRQGSAGQQPRALGRLRSMFASIGPAALVILAVNIGLGLLSLFAMPQLIERCLFRPYEFARGQRRATAITSGFVHADLPHLLLQHDLVLFLRCATGARHRHAEVRAAVRRWACCSASSAPI